MLYLLVLVNEVIIRIKLIVNEKLSVFFEYDFKLI